MPKKHEIVFLLMSFILGLFIAWRWHVYNINNQNDPINYIPRVVNKSIQEDLCDRFKKDLVDFRENPHSFQRASLEVLMRETQTSLRYLLISKGIPKTYPIEYKSDQPLSTACTQDARNWIEIPSGGSQLQHDEMGYLGIGIPNENISPIDERRNVSKSNGKLALVIGNAKYKNRPLRNPINDADDVSVFFTSNGFDVINVRDANLQEMKDAVKTYVDRLARGDIGLVYYSGHGIEYKGRNYLIPINAEIREEEEILRQALDVTMIIDWAIRKKNKVNIFIIDACRTSFLQTKERSHKVGLAKMDGGAGTIVAFSTAPGTVAMDGNDRNSPYTRNLLKAMKVSGRRIEDVFKETARAVETETSGRQIPWYNSGLLVDFSIN